MRNDRGAELKERTKRFSLRVLDLVDALPNTARGRIIGTQLGRAGTSVGANYRAACRGRSKKEFVAKLGNVEEEADECCFWLEVIIAGETLKTPLVEPLLKEANELLSIVVASIRSARDGM